MSQENVEIVSRMLRQLSASFSEHQSDHRSQAAKLQRGEYDRGSRAALDLLHPEATWTTRIGVVYTGKADCGRYVAEILEAWGEYSLSLREITDLGGDQVLAEWKIEAKGATSGVAGSRAIFGLFAIRDGLIFRSAEFSSQAEALKAVGLDE